MPLIGRTVFSMALVVSLACASAEMAGPPVGLTHAAAMAARGPVGSVDADNTIQGRVDITFPNAAPLRGGFTAKWIPSQIFCV
ncbi:MAG TPA: hypothetical protein VGN73_13170 [Gemmatimonadaceae bacterium]|jgi:hypothetical protein|nr:hypothetical protein [Gemmatimonadaceae bacterium]